VPQVLLGDLATRRGDNETARRHYRAAEQLNPNDARTTSPSPTTTTP
jgi:Flp pilus assembly protein TadD